MHVCTYASMYICTLLNSFALVGFDTELVEVIGGVIDFQKVVDDDERLEDTPKRRGETPVRSYS